MYNGEGIAFEWTGGEHIELGESEFARLACHVGWIAIEDI
jgi:hypothetical protein